MPAATRPSLAHRAPIMVALTIVFTFLGIATTYKVAWALHFREIVRGTNTMPANILSCPTGSWPEPAPLWPAPFVGHVTCLGHDSTSWVARAKHTPNGLIPTVPDTEVSRVWQVITIGFPFRCARQHVRFENWHGAVPTGHTPARRVDDGTDIFVSGITVPWRPIWPGLTANAALFGTALFLVFHALRRMVVRLDVVGRLRERRGLCRRCGYDRTGLSAEAPCPECGSAK